MSIGEIPATILTTSIGSMSRPVLLDVNDLIALFDDAHTFHLGAHAWFGDVKQQGWRTCPITELGLVRIMSGATYANGPVSSGELAERLEELKRETQTHEFCADNFSPSLWLDSTGLRLPSSRLTDAYLLNLASIHQFAFATFDMRVKISLIGSSDVSILEYVPN